MSYYLSKNDVKILKQTINTVNNISTGVAQGKRPTIKNAFAYAKLIEKDTNGLWSAKEVYFDETGTASELTDGRTWGGDNPSIIVNGTVSAGQVMRIESYYLIDSSDEQLPVWIGSAVGGGGDSFYRLKCTADITIAKETFSSFFDLVDEGNNVLETGVAVYQSRFDSAFFYEGEIIYGVESEFANYSVDPFIFGIGG